MGDQYPIKRDKNEIWAGISQRLWQLAQQRD